MLRFAAGFRFPSSKRSWPLMVVNESSLARTRATSSCSGPGNAKGCLYSARAFGLMANRAANWPCPSLSLGPSLPRILSAYPGPTRTARNLPRQDHPERGDGPCRACSTVLRPTGPLSSAEGMMGATVRSRQKATSGRNTICASVDGPIARFRSECYSASVALNASSDSSSSEGNRLESCAWSANTCDRAT